MVIKDVGVSLYIKPTQMLPVTKREGEREKKKEEKRAEGIYIHTQADKPVYAINQSISLYFFPSLSLILSSSLLVHLGNFLIH